MDYQAEKKERFAYGLWFLGENIIWAYVALASTFLLDIGIDATLASAILLGPKIWDAVNDTLFGFIVDKKKFKNGEKFMPWIRIGNILIGLMIMLMYAIPASLKSDTIKIAWFVFAYLAMDLAYTLMDAPMFAMPTVMTSNIHERTDLISANRFCGIFGGIIATVLIPIIRPKLGWFVTGVIFSILGTILMIPFLMWGKERIHVSAEKEKEYSFSEMLRYLRTNRYLLISLLLIFVQGASSIESVLSLITARNCLGSESMATVLTAVALGPTILMALLVPKLAKKYDKTSLILFGLIASFAGSTAMYLVGYHNFVLIAFFLMVKGVGISFFLILSYMLVGDSVEYGTYKTGTRATGISFSLQTFTAKMKNAVIGSLSLFALGLFGYDSDLAETVRQSEEVIKGIWAVYNLMPAIGALFCILMLVLFYKMRDKDVEVMAAYNSGAISKQEAEKALYDKYGAAGE